MVTNGYANSTSTSEQKVLLQKLEKIGNDPWYIWWVFFILFGPGIFNGMHITSHMYMTEMPDYWCEVAELKNVWTDEDIRNISSPNLSVATCEMWDFDYSRVVNMSLKEAMNILPEAGLRKTVACRKRSFGPVVKSMNVDYDLVCERTVLRSSIMIIYALGMICGATALGIISDKYGRRNAFLASALLYIASAPVTIFANSITLIAVGRAILGSGVNGVCNSRYILMFEISSLRMRALMTVFITLDFAIGEMLMSILAYFIRDWKILRIVISAPAVLMLVTYWYMPESPLWLIDRGRTKEAAAIINKQYARLKPKDGSNVEEFKGEDNRSCTDDETNIDNGVSKGQGSGDHGFLYRIKRGFLELSSLLKFKELRLRLAITCFTYSFVNMTYNTNAIDEKSTSLDRYQFGFVTGLGNGIGTLLLSLLLIKIGRRNCLVILFITSVIGLTTTTFLSSLESDANIAVIILSILTRIGVSGCYALLGLFVSELFPTVVRNTAIGLGNVFAQFGLMAAPVIVDFAGGYNRHFPSIIVSVFCIVASIILLFLPETRGIPLPNKIEDVTNGSKENLVGVHQICRRTKKEPAGDGNENLAYSDV